MTTFGWSLTRLWPTWFDQDLQVPVLAPITVWFLSLALTVWTLMIRARLNPENKELALDPIVGARSAALAMAGSRVGGLITGLYLGIFLVNYFQRDHEIVGDRLWTCCVAIVGGLVLIAIALWLEKICKIKQPPANTQTPGVPA